MIILAVVLSLLGLSSAALAGGGDWVSYTDETASRLAADSSVGDADTFEKDLAAGDLDNDGDADVLIARKLRFSNPGGLRNVLLINEGGVLTDRTDTLAPDMLDSTDDRDVAIVDVDGDGWLDAVTVTTFSEQPRVYMNLGEIGGVWQGLDWQPADDRIPAFSPPPKFCSVGFGDVTGDLKPDLFFVDYDNSLEDRLLINDGNGFFTDQTAARLTPLMSDSVFGTDAAILDVDGDGDGDIVKNNASGSSPPPGSQDPAVIVLYNDGTGVFDFRQEAYAQAPYMFEPGDFNNDQRIDLFVVDDDQDVYLLNQGNDLDGHVIWDSHTVTQSPKTIFFGGNTATGDLDRDGYLDVYVADVDTDIAGCDRQAAALQNQGDTPDVTILDPLNGASRPWMPTGTFDVLLLDVDGDDTLDIFAGTCTGNSIFIAPTLPFFADGFESGDTSAWAPLQPQPVVAPQFWHL